MENDRVRAHAHGNRSAKTRAARCAAAFASLAIAAAAFVRGGPAGAASPAAAPTPSPASSATATPPPAPAPMSAEASAFHKSSLVADMDCSACHTTDGWKLGPGTGGGEGGFDHAKTGFPLTGEHERATCLACHVPGRAISRECASCHADSHQGRLGAQCDGCHSSSGWRETKAIEAHRKTRLPLTGMHALLDCSACHLRNGERQYTDTPSDCFACHEKDYRNPDTHPAHEGVAGPPPTAPFPRTCTLCHTAVSWSPAFLPAAFVTAPVTLAPAQHERWFPIESGKHRGLPCESCHARGGAAGDVQCQGCHTHSALRMIQVHRGRAMPFDGRACVGCHPGGAAR